jgi:hypothetical protein
MSAVALVLAALCGGLGVACLFLWRALVSAQRGDAPSDVGGGGIQQDPDDDVDLDTTPTLGFHWP